MKRAGLILFALLLPLCAKADTLISIGELREQSQAGWHETYQANGRTIRIDLDSICIPEIDSFPVLKARLLPPLDEEKASVFAKGLVYDEQSREYLHKEDGWGFINLPGQLGWRPQSSFAKAIEQAGGWNVLVDKGYRLAPDTVDWEKAYPEGVKMTVREVDAYYHEVLSRFYPDRAFDLSVSAFEYWDCAYRKTDKQMKNPITPAGSYQLSYRQALWNIPIMGTAKGYLLPDYLGVEGHLSLSIPDEECAVNFRLFEVTDVVHKDVPLCAFDTLKARLEGLIMAGNIRDVHSVELGYAVYPGEDENEFVLLPVFIAKAIYLEDSTQEPARVSPEMSYAAMELLYTDLYFSGQYAELQNDEGEPSLPDILTFDR